jgi:hypothetical protein
LLHRAIDPVRQRRTRAPVASSPRSSCSGGRRTISQGTTGLPCADALCSCSSARSVSKAAIPISGSLNRKLPGSSGRWRSFRLSSAFIESRHKHQPPLKPFRVASGLSEVGYLRSKLCKRVKTSSLHLTPARTSIGSTTYRRDYSSDARSWPGGLSAARREASDHRRSSK